MSGRLTTHVLDQSAGLPAEGVKVELWRIEGEDRRLLRTARTNADGRLDAALLADGELEATVYELVFHAGDYFRQKGFKTAEPAFLELVPIRFGVSDKASHYHVPLLMAPGGYSTYRGS